MSYYDDPDAFPDWWEEWDDEFDRLVDYDFDRWWDKFDDILVNGETLDVSDQPDDFDRYDRYVMEDAEWQTGLVGGYVPTYSGGTIPRRPVINGAEEDVIEARVFYCYTQRAGVTSKIKRAIRRRERHSWRKEIDL